jgi:uncharacterized protein YfaS (alpha-2-macroglobulin family)
MTTKALTPLRYDPSGVFLEKTGLSPADVRDLAPQLEAARREVLDVDIPLFNSGGPVPKEKEPLDAGFFVEKSLHSVSAATLGKGGAGAPAGVARELLAGELVLVDLTVVTPAPRQYVVLDDALPAGLEAIDPKLFTTADWLKNSGFADDASCSGCGGEQGADDASGYRAPYDRNEVRDDRVLFFVDQLPAGLWHYRYLARATTLGRFVLPPTRVEEMYEPEVFGRTATAVIEVRK